MKGLYRVVWKSKERSILQGNYNPKIESRGRKKGVWKGQGG